MDVHIYCIDILYVYTCITYIYAYHISNIICTSQWKIAIDINCLRLYYILSYSSSKISIDFCFTSYYHIVCIGVNIAMLYYQSVNVINNIFDALFKRQYNTIFLDCKEKGYIILVQ